MKMVMIALIAVVLLGGGAAGAYFYFAKPAEASGGPVDEAKKAEHEAKEAEAAEAKVEEFVNLDVLVLPVIDDSGVTQTLTIVVSLEVPDAAAAAEAKRFTPRLERRAYIQDMYGALNRKNIMKDGVLQVALVKERLNRITKKVLGPEKVNDVLLQVVQQRTVQN